MRTKQVKEVKITSPELTMQLKVTQRLVEKQFCYRRVEGAPCGDIIKYIKIRHIMALLARNN